MKRLLPLLAVVLACAALAASRVPLLHSGPEARFVGSQACQDCHEAQFKEFGHSGHGHAPADSTYAAGSIGCESCHGPGSLHVQADGDKSDPNFATLKNFAALPAKEANAVCQSCHKSGDQFYWEHSSHSKEGVACVQCHSMHSAKDAGHARLLRSANASQQCLTCHKDKRALMARSAHMPLREGSMSCIDCHNPHGSNNEHNLRHATVNELCTTCHADKRGPMLWEHAPVRENCLNCHEPHGANNDKVLASKRPFLCQRCHIGTRHPSTLYDKPDLVSNRLFNRSCTNCHSQVHGSNHPSGKFFLR